MKSESIAQATNVVCPDPVNFNPDHAWLFSSGKTMQLRDRAIQTHHDVHVYGRGPLWSDGQYVIESFIMPDEVQQWRRRRKHWRDSVERLFQPSRRFDPPALWVTDNWSFSYFHWTCDALSRLESIAEHQSLAGLTLLLPAKAGRCQFIPETLKCYGLKDVRLLGRFEHLCCRELLVPTHIADTGSYDPIIMQQLRHRFVSGSQPGGVWQSNSSGNERLYISRQLAAHRRVENETEIIPILKEFGFRILYAEKESWQRQVQIASRAGILISSHGAGLTNMIAMDSGARVLEIRDRVNELLYCYYTLAAAMDLDYYYLLADSADPRAKWNRANMVVDPSELRALIERMIADSEGISREIHTGHRLAS